MRAAVAMAVAIAMIAGCGGNKRVKYLTKEEKRRAAIERETELIEDVQARGCACADAACREAIDDELAAYYKVATLNNPLEDVETWPPDLDARGSAALDRVYECLMSNDVVPYSLGVIVVRKIVMLREAACTCDGPTCAQHIRATTDEVTTADAHVPVDEAAQAAITDGLAEISTCLTAVYAKTNKEAVSKLEAIRDAACECHDGNCAADILERAQDWVRLNTNVKTTTEGLEQIANISHELNVCLANAREGAQ